MTDYKEYRISISKELISTKNRVRNFIDNRHWGEEGRYKEIILADMIKNMLPAFASVGTGFVMGDDKLSSQIDIIIYDNRISPLFKKADFVIIAKESVIGIIEVKTKLASPAIEEVVKKSHANGLIINKEIFNGIFSFENGFNFDKERLSGKLVSSLSENVGYINNISFGEDYFAKLWHSPNDNSDLYSFYEISDLSFGYFISNLIEASYKLLNIELPSIMQEYLYPIHEGKEAYKLPGFDIKIR